MLTREARILLDYTEMTVIRATYRTEDLIPAFIDFYKELNEGFQYHNLGNLPQVKDINRLDKEYLKLGRDDFGNFKDIDTAYFILEELVDILNEVAPVGYYFGAHPGDGSDFGFWRIEEGE